MGKVAIGMASGQFYNVKMFGSLFGQRTINEFWFLQEAGSGGANILQDTFRDDLADNYPQLVSSQASIDSVKVYNHNSPTDFTEAPIAPVTGTVTGECLPPYAAYSFACPRARTDIRAGFKRIAGVAESTQANGYVTSGHFQAAMADFCAFLNHDFTDGSGNSWAQIVVKRTKVTVSGKTYYIVPATITTSGYYLAQSFAGVSAVSTQNSRKFGRGQ